MMLVVQVSLESFVNMKDPGKIIIKQCFAGLQRPLSATAYQDDRRATVINRTHGAAQQQFTDIGYKIGIYDTIRLIDPWNMPGALGVSDE